MKHLAILLVLAAAGCDGTYPSDGPGWPPDGGTDAGAWDAAPGEDAGSDAAAGDAATDSGADGDTDTDADGDVDGDTDTDSDAGIVADAGPDGAPDGDPGPDTDTDADCFWEDGARCWAAPAPTLLDHADATAYCSALGSGWRLPTIDELRWALATPCDDGCALSDPLWLDEADAEDCTGCAPWDGPTGGCYWPAAFGDGCGFGDVRSGSIRTDVLGQRWTINYITTAILAYGDAIGARVICVRGID